MKTVLGIDLGTQSIRVVFYDADKQQIQASASSSLELRQDSAGTAEQEAQWWLDGLAQCMKEIPQGVKDSACALAVSGQQHGFVAIDKSGEVVAPVKLWCDTSTSEECEEIMAAMGGEEACIEKLGNPILSGYTASKILWLKKNKPESYQAMDCILLPHDYLNFHLSGERAMEFGDASGTGLMDVRKREWNPEVVKALDNDRDILTCLPPLHHAEACIGNLTSEAAQAYGLPQGIPVATGGGDNMMAAIGTGNVDTDVVTMSLGSSGTVYSHCHKPVVDKRLAAFCSSTGGWLPLLCTLNCTLSTELTRKLFDCDLKALAEAVEQSPIGANGVLTLPFFNGERSPNLPNAKGSIFGLDALNYTPNNMLRSAMEGATYALRMGLEALKENGTQIKEIRLTGGGSRSTAWRQMIADICNTPVVLIEPDEGGAFGAALQALSLLKQSQGEKTSIQELAKMHIRINPDSTSEPISENVKAYEEHFVQYQKAVTLLTSFYQ